MSKRKDRAEGSRGTNQRSRERSLVAVVLVFLSVLIQGTLGYHLIEGWPWRRC